MWTARLSSPHVSPLWRAGKRSGWSRKRSPKAFCSCDCTIAIVARPDASTASARRSLCREERLARAIERFGCGLPPERHPLPARGDLCGDIDGRGIAPEKRAAHERTGGAQARVLRIDDIGRDWLRYIHRTPD